MSALPQAAPTGSPAPAKDDGLGPFSGMDFSDDKVRETILSDTRLRNAVCKTEPSSFTFSQCCGSRVFRDGKSTCTRPALPPKDPRSIFHVDGTKESALAVFDEMYSQEYMDEYYRVTHHYHLYDAKRLTELLGENGAKLRRQGEAERWAMGYTARDTVNLIFSWNVSSQDAIKHFYTQERFLNNAKGLDIDDPVDGKASLIWVDAP